MVAEYLKRLQEINTADTYDEDESSINLSDDFELLNEVESLVKEKVTHNLKYILDIGIGGSNLGTKAVYDKTAAASNNAPLILVGQGHVELLQGKQNEAKQRFESAINASKGKKGNDPNILNAVGRAISESYSEERKTDLDYAISKLTEASQLAASNPDIWLNLGNAYRKKRDGGNAVQAYNKAGNFAPALYKIFVD